MSIKTMATSLVLGLLFISLVAIYLVTAQNRLVTTLSVIIIAICLGITRIGDWREIGIIGTLSAIVSLVAAHLVGLARFGDTGGVLLPIFWGIVLLAVFGWIQTNIVRVPSDRAVLLVRTYTGGVQNPSPPLAPPLLPFLERLVATIPLYELSTDVRVEKINTQGQHNIDVINVNVSYRVESREKAPLALAGIPNRVQTQTRIAKELGQDVDAARTNIVFWEKLLESQMKHEVDDVVRLVMFDRVKDPAQAYKEREALALTDEIERRLAELVGRWGVEVTRLEIDHIEIDPMRFRTRDTETTMERVKAEREATRIKLIREAEAAAESERVTKLVGALKEANVDLTPAMLEDIVISAIQASYDWGLDVKYDPLLPEQDAQRKPADRRDNPSRK